LSTTLILWKDPRLGLDENCRHRSASVGGLGLDLLQSLPSGAGQGRPTSQRGPLAFPMRSARQSLLCCANSPFLFHIWIILELKVLRLERNGVVEEELRNIFEYIWDGVHTKVPKEEARDLGKHEGSMIGQGFGEGGGESRQ
jgi:hypothetical protein